MTQAIIGRAPIVRADYTGDMTAIIANIQTGYASLGDGNKNTIGNKIAEIKITTTTGTNSCISDGAGKYIITFRDNLRDDQVEGFLMTWVNNGTIQ